MSKAKKTSRPPEAKATLGMKKRFAPLLHLWYGRDEGAGELMKHLPKPYPVSELLDRVAEKRLPPSLYAFSIVESQWSDIAGAVAAKHAKPLSLSDGRLLVEIAHPAYLAAVDSPRVKNAILAEIAALVGENVCKEIRFVPRGRTPNAFRPSGT